MDYPDLSTLPDELREEALKRSSVNIYRMIFHSPGLARTRSTTTRDSPGWSGSPPSRGISMACAGASSVVPNPALPNRAENSSSRSGHRPSDPRR